MMGLRHKRNEAGDVIKRKARIVAQGFSQRLGINFDNTYLLVVRYDSMRIIIAYLNRRLSYTIYVCFPPGVHNGGASVMKIN
jgi:hypothetical protein